MVALIFGFVGYGMKKYDWPRPVVIIGLVLSKIAEKNLLLSLRLYKETFLLRPITLILMAILVVTTVHDHPRPAAGADREVPHEIFVSSSVQRRRRRHYGR